VPFTRIATLSPEVEQITLTVGSAGKNFYATGWRVGLFLPPSLAFKFTSVHPGSLLVQQN
jgi:kynurenine aminotransferase